MISLLRIVIPLGSRLFMRIALVGGVFAVVLALFIKWALPAESSLTSTRTVEQVQEASIQKSFDRWKLSEGEQQKNEAVFCSLVGLFCPSNQEKYGSLVYQMTKLAALPYALPPASGVAYTAQSLQQAGFIPHAYAIDGIGFQMIQPFARIWQAFRDITMFILVIVLISIGFMIMFNYNVNPSTQITIQSALPKIILTLIYITFSFAIAGFLIDLMYLSVFFVLELGARILPITDVGELYNEFATTSILGSGVFSGMQGFGIYYKAVLGLYQIFPVGIQLAVTMIILWFMRKNAAKIFGTQSDGLTKALVNCKIDAGGNFGGVLVFSIFLCQLIGILLGAFLADSFAPTIVYILIFLITVAAIIYLYFRILFLMLGSYVRLILGVLFAPLYIVPEAIPGQSAFKGWVRMLMGHLIVFPTIVALLLVVRAITQIGLQGNLVLSAPLLFNFDAGESIVAILNGVILYMIPDLTKTVALKFAGAPKFQANAGTLFGAAAAGYSSYRAGGKQLLALSKRNKLVGSILGAGLTKNLDDWFGEKK
ncbi:MAG: hypothetical protein UZ21_OP11001000553 [Microgenomates bacterium OLB22]|nr:MAG: hypothetical protein UZ21_OP11001000553 [Microgenomates bacterium OLB22]